LEVQANIFKLILILRCVPPFYEKRTNNKTRCL